MKPADFDRLRPRSPLPTGASPATTRQDNEGKRALFSRAPAALPTSGLIVECARCGERSVLSSTAAVRTLLPSVHLPLIRRHHSSYVRCPACGKFSWAKLSIKL